MPVAGLLPSPRTKPLAFSNCGPGRGRWTCLRRKARIGESENRGIGEGKGLFPILPFAGSPVLLRQERSLSIGNMAHAYTPGLRVTPDTVIRKRRLLPIPGEVLVAEGTRVSATTEVAQTALPGKVYPVNV